MKESDIKTNYNESPTRHTLSLLQAALPYVDMKAKHSIGLMVKATELLDSIQYQPAELSAVSLNEETGGMDMEGMLNSLKGHCSHQERDFIDMIMNLTRAQKFYNIYKNVAVTTQENRDGNSNPYAGLFGFNEDINMIDIISSMLTPEQQATFETLNLLLNAVPNS